MLLFGNHAGTLFTIDRNFEMDSFQLYEASLQHLLQLKQHSILVTVGVSPGPLPAQTPTGTEIGYHAPKQPLKPPTPFPACFQSDEEGIVPVVKLWNMDKVGPSSSRPHIATETPRFIRTRKLKSSKPSSTYATLQITSGSVPVLLRAIKINHPKPVVSCVAAHENLQYLAIGIADGTVLLSKGDLTRERTTNRAPRVLFKAPQPVVGMAFRPVGRNIVLFVATVDEVYVCTIEPREHVEALTGSNGGALGCCAISETDGDYWLAHDEELSMYMPEGRGRSLPFTGAKRLLRWCHGYLVVVSTDSQATSVPGGAGGAKMQTVTVCDPDNKFIAYKRSFEDVRHVLYEWGSLFVVAGSGKVYQLMEKDFESKMETLFKKYRFEIAINLAKRHQGESSDMLVQIYVSYADYLYKKKSFDDAVRQYIKTIGKLEPSYVIRKFLDSQRVYNLTDYLQALHDRQLADKHHTTLLLNCYTKLKNVDKLDEFIRTDKELNFDLETAITVCRQAGYYQHALFLAKKFDQHEWCVGVKMGWGVGCCCCCGQRQWLPEPEGSHSAVC